jgi:hypothetical protein
MADDKYKFTLVVQEPPRKSDTLLTTLPQLVVFGLIGLALALLFGGWL